MVRDEVKIFLAETHGNYNNSNYNYKTRLFMKPKGHIYLLIGYLGSGKTSFIRNLLTNKQGAKYAVIQNQFAQGQMGIQQPLIMDESGVPFSSFLELPNGCICCSAKNDLVAGVQYILNNTDVQNIIVETNGLADPAEAIKQFWFDQKMQMNAELHSIITIISVQKYPSLKQDDLFHKQVVYANKVLLTFIDKSTNQQVEEVTLAVRECNAECLIARNNDYNVIQFLAGDNMFHLEGLTQEKHTHKSKQKPHSGIASHSIKGETEHLNKNQFQCAIGQILWEGPAKVMRIKGVVSLEDSPYVYELQGVDDIFELKSSKITKEKMSNKTIILAIGQKIDREAIKNILKIKQESTTQ